MSLIFNVGSKLQSCCFDCSSFSSTHCLTILCLSDSVNLEVMVVKVRSSSTHHQNAILINMKEKK